MKIIIIGGLGTIGKKVNGHLSQKHETITVGRNQGDLNADISNPDSLKKLFATTGKVDAIVCIAGEAKWAPFDELSEEDYYIGIKSKLMGQVNLVRIGQDYLNPGGSFTLTTGILADDPVPLTASASMVNGGLHSFVQAVALETNTRFRINVVSCGLVEDAVDRYQEYFPGHNAIPMDKVVCGYVRGVEGSRTGEVIRIY